MATQYISIQEAVSLTTKSAQTIRRLLKTNKIKSKRQRTPQGFSYLVDKESLGRFFDMKFSQIPAKIPMSESDLYELGVEPDYTRSNKRKAEPVQELYEIPTENATDTIFKITPDHVEIKEVEENVQRVRVEDVSERDFEQQFYQNEAQVQKKTAIESAQFAAVLQQMVKMHQEEKERLYGLIEQFQKRSLILEERIKRLEAPKRSWWHIW